MNQVIEFQQARPFRKSFWKLRILIPLLLACLELPQQAQAVVPPPDGAYPGGNTAEGQQALFSLTTGTYNTAVGVFCLRSNAEGSFNTAIGAGTLLLNTGSENTATGTGALLNNTTGASNTANGAFALVTNTEGVFNTSTGVRSLFSNTTGSNNTANGFDALLNNTTGASNTATGADALFSNSEGSNNTANGFYALLGNTGSSNTAVGFQAMSANTSGSFNTAVGDSALSQNSTGGGNTVLGYQAGVGIHTADNVIAIRASGEDVSNSCYIGEIFGSTSPGGTAVFINGVGKLGTATSSRRFKEDIKPMDKASEVILALKPVTFRYKKEIDPAGRSQFGLVAEEVEKVNSDLVVRDKEGKTYSVRYDQVNAMLLNEFLKEHKEVEKLEATVEAINTRLQEQAAQIQKVTAQGNATKPLAHLVLNNP